MKKSLQEKEISAGTLDFIGVGVLTGLMLALVYLLLNNPAESLFKKGDFPGFYAAAVLLEEQGGSLLYDRQEQSKVQNRFWPTGQYYYFSYPPFYALLLRPLAFFDPLVAKVLLWSFLAACVPAISALGAGIWPLAARSKIFAAAFMLCCLPVLISFVIGQNTLLSMLLYTGGAALLLHGSKASRFWGGFVFALWLFKPQLGAPALALIMLTFDRLLWRGAIAGMAFCYLAGILVAGYAWPLQWLHETLAFGAVNYTLNGQQMVSLGGLASVARSALSTDGFPAAAVRGFHLLSWSAVFFITAAFFLKSYKACGVAEKQRNLSRGLALLGPAVVLMGEQVLFYDFGVVLVGLLFFLKADSVKALTFSLAINGLISLAQYHYTSLSISPLALAVVFSFIFTLLMIHRLDSA